MLFSREREEQMAKITVREKLQITSSDLNLRKNWVGLTEDELQLLRNCKEFLAPQADEIVKEFYDFGFTFREFSQIVERNGSMRQRLEGAQKAYFLEALEGRIDDSYVDRRLVIGSRHAELDIQPRWNVGAYALYFSLIFPRLAEHLAGETLVKTQVAWSKLLLFDLTLAIEGYISEGMITRLVGASSTIGQAAAELTANAGQVDTAAQEIAKAIQEVAAGSTKQTEVMGQTAEQMKELTAAIQEVTQAAERTATTSQEGASITNSVADAISGVTSDANAVNEIAEKARDAATNGQQSVEKTVKGLETIRDAVNTAAQQVEELGKRGDEIGGIVETIDDVASQTNLLALNAAIEAARAGEQGRGFAVVADNVRALAERAAESSKQISKLVGAVQQGVRETVQAMQAGVSDVEKGMEVASEAGEALQNIVNSNSQVSEGIGRIAEGAKGMAEQANQLQTAMSDMAGVAQQLQASSLTMAESSEKVSQAVTEASAQAEQAAASSEQVSASVEQVTAQIGEISSRTAGLNDEVDTLDQIARLVLESDERMELYRQDGAQQRQQKAKVA
jgi:methyl-accepting chemotaxis protein